jgi:hypothetical protein
MNSNLINLNALDHTKTNRGGVSLRKSLEFDRNKIPDELLKKGGGMSKPTLFKNLAKNLSVKYTSASSVSKETTAVKIKRNDSGISGSVSVKTSENL